jgi:hypothetical protein
MPRLDDYAAYCQVMIETKDVFMIRMAVYLIVALTFGAANVTAQEGGHKGTKDEQQACTPDVYKFCEAAIPNEDRIVACLKANLKLLSPDCRKVIRG